MPKKYIVIGASCAGINGAKTLRELDKDCEITLVSKDTMVYSRVVMHHYIENLRSLESLNFAVDGDQFFERYNVNWIKGVEVTKINPMEHNIELDDGRKLEYDKVLVCTGASSFFPPVENLREANNVIGFRNIEDAFKMKEMAQKVKNIVILGAGLVGVDALAALMPYDVNLTMVDMADRFLKLQLDEYSSNAYRTRLEEKGVKFVFNASAKKVIVDENNNCKGVELSTGETIDADFLIVCAGVRPNVSLLKDSGIECDRFGLIINSKGETNARDVYGAGDITGRTPIWPMAFKQGIIAACNMCGVETYMQDFFGAKNTMNFAGLATMSLGIVEKPDDTYEEVMEKKGEDYKKVIYKDGAIYGAIVQGDLSYVGVLTQLIREKIDIRKVKKNLFDVDYSDFFNLRQDLQFTY